MTIPDLEPLVQLRHDLHAWPEAGFEEHKTSERIRMEMERLGFSPRPAAGTGLVVDTRPNTPVAVALRADMDALLMDETGVPPWRSQNPGRMHACGHDGHMTILVGVAQALAALALPVNVRLLFQPAEEGGGGGRIMAEEGVMDGVPEVYGLHNWPTLPFGKIAVREGPVMAASDRFVVVFRGVGCHGSQPHQGVDPVLAAGHFIVGVQSVVSRRRDPLAPVVVSLGRIAGGSAYNVIPDEVRVEGTARTLDDAMMERVRGWVGDVASSAAGLVGARADLQWIPGYPVTCNHPIGVARVREAVQAVLGVEACVDVGLPSMGGEDMSYLLRRAPGAYFFLGTGRPGGSRPIHASDFDFNDDAILPGVRLFSWLVAQVAREIPSK